MLPLGFKRLNKINVLLKIKIMLFLSHVTTPYQYDVFSFTISLAEGRAGKAREIPNKGILFLPFHPHP
jgi:hypothetical protein